MSKPPQIDIGAILARENQAKINHIHKYNDKSCKLETKGKKVIPVVIDGRVNPELNGAIVIPYNDFIRFQNWAKTECLNYNENK